MALENPRSGQGKPIVSDDPDGVTDENNGIQPGEGNPSDGGANPNNSGSNSWELLINGEKKTFNEEELIEFVQKGIDYSQKTMLLADEKKRLEPYQPFIDKMSTDAAYANAMIEASNEIESQENQSSDSGADSQTRAQILNLQKQVSDLAMGTKFNILEEKYKKSGVKIDRVEIAAYASANGITDPEVAFIMLNNDALSEAARQEGIKIGKGGGGDNNKVIVHHGKPGTKTMPEVETKDMSAKDKKARAIAVLENM